MKHIGISIMITALILVFGYAVFVQNRGGGWFIVAGILIFLILVLYPEDDGGDS